MSDFAQSVRVGDSQRIHVRDSRKRNFTACGLREDAPLLQFRNVLAQPTCPYCLHPAPAMKSA